MKLLKSPEMFACDFALSALTSAVADEAETYRKYGEDSPEHIKATADLSAAFATYRATYAAALQDAFEQGIAVNSGPTCEDCGNPIDGDHPRMCIPCRRTLWQDTPQEMGRA